MTEEVEHPVNIAIPEACLSGDPNCPCYVKPEKREYNPV